ncbi:hypothetical protein HKL94_01615 [Candidatus Parcubacteria bacterium]|nr:hypothetical protein [Candidatus Parcubacteria bacterium]
MKKILPILFLAILAGSVPHVFAAGTNGEGGATGSWGTQTQSGGNTTQTQSGGNTTNSNITLINPLQGGGTLQGFLTDILNFVIRIGAIVVVFMLVFVGYKFVAARGAPKEIEDARRMLLYTIIGALILLGAQAISLGIQQTVQALSTGQ